MRCILTVLILIIGFCVTTHAQRYSKEFGKIGKDEFDLRVYAKDKSASAVVLFDIGKSRFTREENGFSILFEHQKRIKILSKPGLKYAQVEIPFYREGNIFEKIYDIEAITYNFENGALKRTTLAANNWHDEKVNDLWMVRKFAFPDVKEGSIVEFRYKLNSQYLFNLRDWSFQSKIPTVYSNYEVRLIPFYEYSYITQGIKNFDSHQSYVDRGIPRQFGATKFNDVVHTFTMNNIAAFKSEDFITSINDYIIKIDFQLAKIYYPSGNTQEIMTTWPDMINGLNKHADFGKFIKKCQKLSTKLIKIDSNNSSEKVTFNKVINFVKGNYKWNGTNGKYATKSPNNLIKDKFGNSADLNLFAIGLLNDAGIEAYPVLISTRKHGKVRQDYPFAHLFNYVVIYAKVDNKNIITDATDINTSNYRIPTKCINDKGLVITANKEIKWIGLESAIPSLTASELLIKFTKELTNVKVNTYTNEYSASELNETIGEDKAKLTEYLNLRNYDISDTKVEIVSLENQKQIFKYNFELSMPTENINEKLYIKPFINEVLGDNPLNQDSRSYPIDMIYPTKNSLSSTIDIPDGYEVDYIPENYKIKNDLFELDYQIIQSDRQIKITFSNYFKKSVYPAEKYSDLKFYFKEIIKRGNEKIVLRKKV